MLREPDNQLLKAHLEIFDKLRTDTRQTEKWVAAAVEGNKLKPILESFPGIGPILGALIALEVDTIERFNSPEKFAAYCGLVPSTYSSSGHTTHGRMIPSNRHLKYAFIEAAWNASRSSPYFQTYFERLKERKGSCKAVGAVARKMSEIAYFCMKHNRAYQERVYRLGKAVATPLEQFSRVALASV